MAFSGWGTEGETRTRMPAKAHAPETCASTNSATSVGDGKDSRAWAPFVNICQKKMLPIPVVPQPLSTVCAELCTRL